jgi:tetraacyldisaccharide 4'-kinase
MQAPSFWWTPHLTPLSLLLAPLGWAYGKAAQGHGTWRARHPYYAAAPMVAIGNLVAGGAGKTPLVQALAGHYAAKGHMVAVVLRGYGGTESALPLQVTFQHTATQVGDEALALYRALPRHVQVWVGRHRPSVVKRAEQAGATFIVLDDAFQRQDLKPSVNLLVLNGQPHPGQDAPTPFGNGLCMPAGPLREPLSALKRATLAVVMNEPITPPHAAPPYYGISAYRLAVKPTASSVQALKGKPLFAFAGLGQPSKFFEALRNAGLNVVGTLPLPDHTRYPTALLREIQAQAAALGTILVTTPKDAAKLPAGFAHTIEAEVVGSDWDNLIAAIDLQIAGNT